MSLNYLFSKLKGGAGSGNIGHAGIPGHQGGSAPKGLVLPIRSSLPPPVSQDSIHEKVNLTSPLRAYRGMSREEYMKVKKTGLLQPSIYSSFSEDIETSRVYLKQHDDSVLIGFTILPEHSSKIELDKINKDYRIIEPLPIKDLEVRK